MDAGNAWSDTATAGVRSLKKQSLIFMRLFLLPICCVLLYDIIDIICSESPFSFAKRWRFTNRVEGVTPPWGVG